MKRDRMMPRLLRQVFHQHQALSTVLNFAKWEGVACGSRTSEPLEWPISPQASQACTSSLFPRDHLVPLDQATNILSLFHQCFPVYARAPCSASLQTSLVRASNLTSGFGARLQFQVGTNPAGEANAPPPPTLRAGRQHRVLTGTKFGSRSQDTRPTSQVPSLWSAGLGKVAFE